MALTVETGAGLPDAEAYLSAADASTYHAARGNAAWAELTDGQKEAALRAATAYIDTITRYKGARLLASQSLEFPRASLYDWSGHEVSGVPLRVKHACAELALRASSTSLYTDLARGGKIKSESVGPISTTYADDAPVGTEYTVAMNLLKPYSRDSGPRMGSPGVSLTDAPYFTTGMHDTPQE